jgi:hypothetical protein
MNKKICAIALAIFIVMPLLAAAATQRVQAQSTAISLIDQSVVEQTHTYFYADVGATINLTLYVQDVSSLWSWKVNVTWDNSILQLAPTDNVTEGPFLSNNGASSTLFLEAPPTPGNIPELSSTLLENTSVTGSGALAYLAFTVQNLGNTTINITGIRLLNPSGTDITTIAPISKTLVIHGPGDITGDGHVSILDAIILADAFLSTPGSPNWNPAADIGNFGVVNILDAILLADNFGQSYSYA